MIVNINDFVAEFNIEAELKYDVQKFAAAYLQSLSILYTEGRGGPFINQAYSFTFSKTFF